MTALVPLNVRVSFEHPLSHPHSDLCWDHQQEGEELCDWNCIPRSDSLISIDLIICIIS